MREGFENETSGGNTTRDESTYSHEDTTTDTVSQAQGTTAWKSTGQEDPYRGDTNTETFLGAQFLRAQFLGAHFQVLDPAPRLTPIVANYNK
jgi:hypothetical protein